MPVRRVPLNTLDHVDVVVTLDTSIAEAWTADEQARYRLLEELPDMGIPASATRFRLRPMDYLERQRERDASQGRFSPRGLNLLEHYIEAMRDAHRDGRDARRAGDDYRDRLEPGDRQALADASVASMLADEALCARCVDAVFEGNQHEAWDDVLEVIDSPTQVIAQLARHIRRISKLGERQGF